MNRREILLSGAAAAACARAETPPVPSFPMRRGVNLGGGLEAPNEGDWGYRVERAHLSAIAAAGFDGIRLPVRWDTHAAEAAPFAIAPDYLARVEEIVGEALQLGLKVQLDLHHYGPLVENPAREAPRFRALWRQIAEAFADAPPALMFEPFNEPHGDWWTGARVRAYLAMAIAEIRASNPTRLVIVGGPNWNSISGLEGWRPPADPHLALTAHYYEPYAFTHERAEWMGAEAPAFGRVWGDDADIAQVREHIAHAARLGARSGLALQIGEFGVNRAMPTAQRALWTRTVRQACEANGLGWCVWDFGSTFEIYRDGAFVPDLLAALME